jgi:aspartate aminotransferase-like enzyme
VNYHRSPEFRQILGDVLEDLKYILSTKNTIIPLTSSGTGALEAAARTGRPRTWKRCRRRRKTAARRVGKRRPHAA